MRQKQKKIIEEQQKIRNKKQETGERMKRKKTTIFKRTITITIFIIIVFFAAGCNKSIYISDDTRYKKDFFAMDTYMEFTAYGKNAEEGLEKAIERVEEIEKIFSVTNKDSEVYAVNHRTENTVQISQRLMDMLEYTFKISQTTEGTFDISIYPVLCAWGFTTSDYQIPSQQEITDLLKNTGYDKMQIDSTKNELTLQEGMEIDFGGIAKGYSGDEAIQALKECGVDSAILSLGGNIQALGSKPDGSAWNIAVKNPDNTESYMGILQVRDKAVVTSGGYERFFEGNDGEIYWHILNPATGYPAKQGLISVTIIGKSGRECDALSTALFVKGLDGAIEYWKKYGGFEAIFVTEERELYITEGLSNAFTPEGEYKEKEVKIIFADKSDGNG